MNLEALVFDLDGTLGDTLPVCYEAFRIAFLEFLGRRYADAEIRGLFGPSEEGVIQRLVPDRWQECLSAYLAAYDRVHRQRATSFLGIEQALSLLQERGVRLGIVTGKGPGSAEISLRHLGLAPYFEAVEAGSAGGGVKPAAIRGLLERWGVAPAHAAYIGDLPYDVRAAREAGVLSLGAAWAPAADAQALRDSGAYEVFATVEELSIWIASHAGS